MTATPTSAPGLAPAAAADPAYRGRPGAGTTVALFAACYNDTVWPGTPISTVKVLERLGVRVVFPRKQTCCGQIFTNTGYAAEAIPLVRGFVDTFAAFDYVVAPSGSCVGAVREQHHQLAERSGDAGNGLSEVSDADGGFLAIDTCPVVFLVVIEVVREFVASDFHSNYLLSQIE